jgi:serpin B
MWKPAARRVRETAALVATAAVCALAASSCGAQGATSAGVGVASQHTKPLAASAATAALGMDLLRLHPDGNLVLSPDNIAAALAMAGTGARGATAAQIARTLHLASPAAFAAVGELQSQIAREQTAAARGDPEPPALWIANGLFLQEGLGLQAPFLATLKQSFEATPQAVDFAHQSTAAVGAINAWISDHTDHVIPAALQSVPSKTVLALANAVYFKALWSEQFVTGAFASIFHTPDGPQRAPFMSQTARLPYMTGRGYSAVELPYASSTISMLVVLPSSPRGLPSLQRRFGVGGLQRIVGKMRSRNVELKLPKFHIAAHDELAGDLEALGMPLAFSDRADFAGMAAGGELKLGDVIHAADIRVDERGTTAAAATVVTVEPTSEEVIRNPVHFDANHPFLFFLRDRRTGTVLFAGRLVDDAAAQD